MNQNTPSLHMIFSTQPQSGESEHQALSFYLEDSQWSRLLELIDQHGNFEIYKLSADEFRIHLGDHRFSVLRDFNKVSINMLDISLMNPGAAELMAKIADLVFFDRKRRFMILASKVEHEKMAWSACQTLEIPIKPENKDQADRFQAWNAEHQLAHKAQFKSFAQSVAAPSADDPAPGASKK